MRILRSFGAALAGVTLAAGLGAATTAPAHAVQFCREAWVSKLWIGVVCVTGEVHLNGTLVDGYVAVDCVLLTNLVCSGNPIGVGATGFEPEPNSPQLLEVDPATASVRTNGLTVGYVWVDGVRTPARVPGFCVGDPAFC